MAGSVFLWPVWCLHKDSSIISLILFRGGPFLLIIPDIKEKFLNLLQPELQFPFLLINNQFPEFRTLLFNFILVPQNGLPVHSKIILHNLLIKSI